MGATWRFKDLLPPKRRDSKGFDKKRVVLRRDAPRAGGLSSSAPRGAKPEENARCCPAATCGGDWEPFCAKPCEDSVFTSCWPWTACDAASAARCFWPVAALVLANVIVGGLAWRTWRRRRGERSRKTASETAVTVGSNFDGSSETAVLSVN